MVTNLRTQFFGFTRLIWLNLHHYWLAAWGFGLRLDPDYPLEGRFRPDLLSDSVMEYRTYSLFAPWCAFLALVLPLSILFPIAAWWAIYAWKRAGFYKTALAFWRQAYQESPKKLRVQIRYAEEIALQIERLDKAGHDWISPEIQHLVNEGLSLQEVITKGKQK